MKYHHAELIISFIAMALLCVYAKWITIVLALLAVLCIIVYLCRRTKTERRKGNSTMANVDAQSVYDLLTRIPRGKVVTYGDIAEYLGNKNLARTIGNILHANPDKDKYPCYKVVRSNGKLAKNYAFGGVVKQKELLMKENIEVKNDQVDLSAYRWNIP